MKKLYLIAIVSACFLQLHSQAWLTSNRLISGEEVVSIASASDADANIYLYGYFTLTLSASSGESVTSYGGRDYFVAKLDSLSNVLWLQNLGSAGNDYIGGGLKVADDGSVYITGGFRDELFYTPSLSITSTGGFDTFILKYDPDGNVVWIKHSGQGPGNQRPNSLALDASSILISGFFTDMIDFDGEDAFTSNNAIDDFYYASFSQTDGSLNWAKQCRGIDNPASGRITAIRTDAGYYSFAGLFLDSISIGDDTLVSDDIDAFVMKTDLDGNVTWIRQVSGATEEYTYTVEKDDSGSGDIYLSGFFNSATLVIDSTDVDQVSKDLRIGGFDIMILKYASDGTFQWILGEGGPSTDKVWDINSQGTIGTITGSFTGSMNWGGIPLTADGGATDVDMYVASFSNNGELLGANSYGGRSNSREEGRNVFENNGKTYVVLRSDSDLLVLGDSSYISPGGVFYLAVGVIGCKADDPVKVDLVSPTDLTCYNDSTGEIVIIASGGFGGPYQYSIDNGASYFGNNGIFTDLPSLDYQIKVLDAENCIGTGPTGTIDQPDSIVFTFTVTDPSCHDDVVGSIEFDTPTGGSNSGWMFSIDSGMNYQPEALFADVPIDDFYLMVKESGDCESAAIDTAYVIPEELTAIVDSMHNMWINADGYIAVSARGGAKPYTWKVNDLDGLGTSPTDSTFRYETSVAGTYVVTVVDVNNCGPVEAGTLTTTTGFETPTGIGAKIYPNPTTGRITIEMPSEEPEGDLQVLNMSGQIVLQRKVYSSGGLINESLDLSGQASGLYLIRINGQALQSAIMVK